MRKSADTMAEKHTSFIHTIMSFAIESSNKITLISSESVELTICSTKTAHEWLTAKG